jgi:hypothetical protein
MSIQTKGKGQRVSKPKTRPLMISGTLSARIGEILAHDCNVKKIVL